MKKDTKLLLILKSSIILFLPYIASQVPFKGKCPHKNPLHPVDIRKLSGVWYELERTSSLGEWPYQCITFKIQPFFEYKSSATITVIHRFSGKLENHKISLGVASGSEGKQDGKVVVNMTLDGLHAKRDVPIQILANDNSTKSWVVAWSCENFHNEKMHTEVLWVFSRRRIMENKIWDEIQDALVSLSLDNYRTRETLQSSCDKENGKDEDEEE